MNPEHYAVVVGIDHYPDIGHLQAARRDATAFQAWLLDPAGGAVPRGNCKLITATLAADVSRAAATPVVAEVRSALLDFMDEADALFKRDVRRWERTRLYYYVSGHGLANGAFDASLLMANAGKNWWSERVSCEEIYDYLVTGRQSFREVAVFADCCRGRIPDESNATLGLPKYTSRTRGPIQGVCIYPSEYGARAYEPSAASDLLRGFLTRALLDGLRGAAADPGEAVDSENLGRYVKRLVPQLTSAIPLGPQKPVVFHVSDPIVFRAAAAPPSPAAAAPAAVVTLEFEQFTGPLRLMGGDLRPVAGVPPFNASPGARWTLQGLPPGLYSVEPADGSDAGSLHDNGQFKVVGPPKPGGAHVKL